MAKTAGDQQEEPCGTAWSLLGWAVMPREASCKLWVRVWECVCVGREKEEGGTIEVGHREGPLWVLNLQRHGQGTTKAVAGGDFTREDRPHIRLLAPSHWTELDATP